MSAVVIYKSKYGATKKYAEWISEVLGADLFNIRKFDKEQFANYDTIILGGGTYAGNINGLSLISKNYDMLKGKNIIIFTVGMKDPTKDYNKATIHSSLLKVLTPEMLQNIKVFSMRGELDASKINVLHYSMLKILVQMVDHDEEHLDTDEIRAFHAALEKPVSFVEYDQIKPLVNYVKTMHFLK